ncbi:MAG: conjugal transfer protein TraG N-terminal domain-containing protein [Thermodesulfovibrionales bacterium]
MEVFTYGNSDFLIKIFTAVRDLMGSGSFTTLTRISILLGFLILFYQLFFSMNVTQIFLGIVRQYVFVIVMFYVLLVPKADVVIYDQIKNVSAGVNNVPYGVALFAHIFTSTEKGLTTLFENSFSLPNDMRFNKTGFAFSVMLLDSFKNATPTDPYFKRTLNDYIKDCFFTSVLWGEKDLNTVIYSNNIWGEMTATTHSQNSYTKTYSSTVPSGQATTCSNAYGVLDGQFGTATVASYAALQSYLQADVVSATPTVLQNLLNVGTDATTAMKHAIGVNMISSAMAETATMTGVSADAVAYAAALSQQQQRSAWATGGEMAKKYMPIIRQILEAFIYGMFPVLFLMMLTPLGGKTLHMYFIMLFWLMLWSPLYAILNLIVNVRAATVLSSSQNYFAMGTMPLIYESTNDLVAMAGYMAWAVPMIAFAIAKGSDSALVHLASSIQGSTNLTQNQAAGAVTGTEGATRMAQAEAHYKAAQSYGGADIVTTGMAAKAFKDMGANVAYGGMSDPQLTKAGTGQALSDMSVNMGNSTAISNQGGVDAAAQAHSNQQEKSIAYGTTIGSGGALGTFAGQMDTSRMEGYSQALQSWKAAGNGGGMVDMLTATTSSEMIKNINDKQAYRNALNSRADYHQGQNPGMDRDTAVAAAASEFSNIEANRKHGGDLGWQKSYDTARAHGFQGSEMQYASYLSEMANMRSYADSASMQNVADKHWGGDTVGMLTERANFHNTQAAAELKKMEEKGYSAESMGQYMGSISALKGVAASEFYQEFGDKGVLTSEGGKMQNELGKFEMLQNAAVASGYGDKDGNLSMGGFQNFLRDHHGVDIKSASKDGINTISMNHEGKEIYREQRGQIDMNNPAHRDMIHEAQKDNPNFKPQHGDNFHVGGGPAKKFATAQSVGGAVSQHNNRDESNAMNTVQKGTTSTIGNFGTYGSRHQTFHENSEMGFKTITDPNTGRSIGVVGNFQYAPDDKHHANPISASFTNVKSGEIFTAQKVTDRGQETWQFGIDKVQISPDGKKVSQFNSLSSQSVSTGGYASESKIAPDGMTLYQKADGGQQVNWWHQFKMNFEKGANVSTMGFIAQGDLTNLNSAQTTAIFTGGATKNAVERVTQIMGVMNQGKAFNENAAKSLPSAPKGANKIDVNNPGISAAEQAQPLP